MATDEILKIHGSTRDERSKIKRMRRRKLAIPHQK